MLYQFGSELNLKAQAWKNVAIAQLKTVNVDTKSQIYSK